MASLAGGAKREKRCETEGERTRERLLLPARRLDTIEELRPPHETGPSTAIQQRRRH